MIVSRKLVIGLLSVISVFLFSASSHVMMPRGPIPVTREVVGSMDVNKAISFENGAPETKPSYMGNAGLHKYYANYRLWTGFIIGHLETELKDRGVQVKPDSEEVFKEIAL